MTAFTTRDEKKTINSLYLCMYIRNEYKHALFGIQATKKEEKCLWLCQLFSSEAYSIRFLVEGVRFSRLKY